MNTDTTAYTNEYSHCLLLQNTKRRAILFNTILIFTWGSCSYYTRDKNYIMLIQYSYWLGVGVAYYYGLISIFGRKD